MNQIDFTPEEIAAFREELFQGFTESQFNLAIAECKRRNLVPGQHVFFQLRNSSEWDPTIGASVKTKKLTKVTTIDAFRLISHRTGEYAGQGKAKFYYLDEAKQPSIVSEIPLPHPTTDNAPREPWACSVPIYRKGFVEPVEVVCRFDAYAVTRKSGQNVVLTDMWQRRGPEQLAKCAEAASRRVAYPEELGSFYLSEEFAREDAENAPAVPDTPAPPVTEAPKPVSVPAVNHAPATPTNEPRPNEEAKKPKKAAKDTKIEDVVLDKVEVVSEPVVENTPAPVEEPVQKMDAASKIPPADRCRALLTAGVNKDNLGSFILKKSGKTDRKTLTAKEWDDVLTPLEKTLASEGKDAVNEIISKKDEV